MASHVTMESGVITEAKVPGLQRAVLLGAVLPGAEQLLQQLLQQQLLLHKLLRYAKIWKKKLLQRN
jgi:hypothetical protein